MRLPWQWLLGGMALMSLLAFCLMGLDKRRAQRGAWRVRERTLFLAALLGGAPGGMLGMYAFRHKTRRRVFRWGLPLLALGQALLVIRLLWGGKGPLGGRGQRKVESDGGIILLLVY